MKNRKRLFKSIININGTVIDNNCPNCDGDGYFLEDNTNAKGGLVQPSLCSLCEGNGIITEDVIERIEYDEEGFQHIIFKEGDELYGK